LATRKESDGIAGIKSIELFGTDAVAARLFPECFGDAFRVKAGLIGSGNNPGYFRGRAN
jgi:hypothetical protein